MKSLLIPENPRLIVFKMTINRGSLPEGMELYRPETAPRALCVKLVRGQQVAHGQTCNVSSLMNALTGTHVLVEAYYTNAEPGYVCAHFIFSLRQYAQIKPGMERTGPELQAYLGRLLGQMLWKTDAWVNPFLEDGNPIPGFYCAAINCRKFSAMGTAKDAPRIEFGAPQQPASSGSGLELATA